MWGEPFKIRVCNQAYRTKNQKISEVEVLTEDTVCKHSKDLEELKQLHPKLADYIGNHIMMSHIHGDIQSLEEKEVFTKYTKIMKSLGVLDK